MTTDRAMGLASRVKRLVQATAAVSLASLVGCGEEPPPPEPIIRPVRSERVFATGGERTRSFSGTAQAAVESRLSFKVAGTVDAVAVEVGTRVKAGATIAALDDRDFRLQVQEAEAGLASAEAQATNAEANYERVRALWENRNASRNDLAAARAAAVSARENVNSVAKRAELARVQLEYTSLRAKVAGAISEVLVEANENVSPGQPVVVLTSGKQLEVVVAIPEVLIAAVSEGDGVSVDFDAIDRTLRATVTEVGVATGTATTFPVTVRLDSEEPNVRPGMAAEVAFAFGGGSGREHIYVPAVSVGEDRNGRYVFVVAATGDGLARTERRNVTIGSELVGEAMLEILDGLKDGEEVVTAGVSRILDGQQVRMLPK